MSDLKINLPIVPVLAESEQRLNSAKDDLNISDESRESTMVPERIKAGSAPANSLGDGQNTLSGSEKRPCKHGPAVERGDLNSAIVEPNNSPPAQKLPKIDRRLQNDQIKPSDAGRAKARETQQRKFRESKERFALEYVKDSNGTQAAIRAGYAPQGAPAKASKMLALPEVREMIESHKKEQRDRLRVSVDDVVDELRKLGFSNMCDYMTVGGDGYPRLDFSKLTREQTAALSEVTVDEYYEGKGDNARPIKKVKFKLIDKISALDKLAKNLGMYKDESAGGNAINVGQLNVTVMQSMRRLATSDTVEGEFQKL